MSAQEQWQEQKQEQKPKEGEAPIIALDPITEAPKVEEQKQTQKQEPGKQTQEQKKS